MEGTTALRHKNFDNHSRNVSVRICPNLILTSRWARSSGDIYENFHRNYYLYRFRGSGVVSYNFIMLTIGGIIFIVYIALNGRGEIFISDLTCRIVLFSLLLLLILYVSPADYAFTIMLGIIQDSSDRIKLKQIRRCSGLFKKNILK